MAKYEIRIDRKKCIGAGFCEKVLPAKFTVDSSRKVVVKNGSGVDDKSLQLVLEAAMVCPVYAIDIINKETGKSAIQIKPGKKAAVRFIKANYDSRKEWKMDPNGFFTIKPFPEEGVIRVRYYNAKHQLTALIEGKTAEEIYATVCREGFVSVLSHAAYLGTELMKAEIAMKKKLDYVQDGPLRL